jgi:hypothetical protein
LVVVVHYAAATITYKDVPGARKVAQNRLNLSGVPGRNG